MPKPMERDRQNLPLQKHFGTISRFHHRSSDLAKLRGERALPADADARGAIVIIGATVRLAIVACAAWF